MASADSPGLRVRPFETRGTQSFSSPNARMRTSAGAGSEARARTFRNAPQKAEAWYWAAREWGNGVGGWR